MTPEEHLKSQNNEFSVSVIVPRGDPFKGKAKQANKLLKDTCTKENMHFICDTNIC